MSQTFYFPWIGSRPHEAPLNQLVWHYPRPREQAFLLDRSQIIGQVILSYLSLHEHGQVHMAHEYDFGFTGNYDHLCNSIGNHLNICLSTWESEFNTEQEEEGEELNQDTAWEGINNDYGEILKIQYLSIQEMEFSLRENIPSQNLVRKNQLMRLQHQQLGTQHMNLFTIEPTVDALVLIDSLSFSTEL